MIRLQLKNAQHSVKDDFLALPGAQPLTLHQVSSENLPYACQCPLCGGLFELPAGVLYKLKEDDLEDSESGLTQMGPGGGPGGEEPGEGFLGGNEEVPMGSPEAPPEDAIFPEEG